ncbi:hypothetical protein DKX38_012118 [Salix brachista]|uniref:RING-type domain-containing protein n=1 Tax=Salix brachista TaxID=2182728 RepID=A0A5N5LPX4_9ROSI|nr:hypothetical protein DKX38_012118 [Salix brachista]
MNSSTDYNHTVHVSSAYDTGMAFGVLILILIVALVAYSCSCCVQEPSTYPITNQDSSVADRGSVVIDIGLNEATLASYSKVLYSQAKLQHESNDSQPFGCSICLGDYEDNDMLSILHVRCAGIRWRPLLSLNPLAEVASLAARAMVQIK